MKTTCSPNSGAHGNATRRLACLGLAVAMLAGWTVSAATLHVWPDSPNPMPPYDSWDHAAANIQDAVDAAQPGDLVLVTNGVYATGERAVGDVGTNRVVVDEAVTLQSVNGPVETVIDGANSARCVYLGTNAILSGFTLMHGHAESGGGAWCESSGTLTNCVVAGNFAVGRFIYFGTSGGAGGGVYGGTLYNCLLSGNSAPEGYYNSGLGLGGPSPSFGGGTCQTILHNCILTNNVATFGGGTYGGTLYNSVLTGNSAAGLFGTGGVGGAFDSELYNCTVTDNSGGGVAGSTLYNCVVYFNSATNYTESTFNYSCTTPLPSDGTNNISVDPQMATLTHLSASSPCIAAGSSAYASGVDIDGEPWANPPCMGADQRSPGPATGALTVSIEADYTNVVPGFVVRFVGQILGARSASVWDFDDGTIVSNQPVVSHAWSAPGSYTVRLTAYNDSFPGGVSTTVQIEVPEGVYYVNQANPTPVYPYTSWATAATNIQDAIGAETAPGRLVLVTDGVYASGTVSSWGTNRIALPNRVQVRSVNGPEVTVIEGAPGIRCAYVGKNAILSGFTLTHGGASYGGGAYCGESAILSNCVVTANSAESGGGVDRGTLYNCCLTGNSAAHGGGSEYGILYNCTVTGNSASDYGGGVSFGTFYNCIVYYNTGPSDSNYYSGSFNYSCTAPLPSNGTNNISEDPRMASLSHLTKSSPCIAAGNSAYATGVDIDGEPWANPPCMGADQVTPGPATGALTMSIEAEYTNVAPGTAVRFAARSSGAILASAWDFDDGTIVSNQPIAIHAWSAPGSHTVRLTGYNDSFPEGVSVTVQVEVSGTVYYVNQANPTPVFPYTSWATAATNIQDAIEAGTAIGRPILVTNGVYASGGVAVGGSNRIALTGVVQVRSVNGPEVTVIEGAPGIRCAFVGTNAILSGFTLSNGDVGGQVEGGGAFCAVYAVLTNCVVTNNSAGVGGGVYRGTLYNCILSGNSAANGGGCSGGTLYNCTLTGNSASNLGGAVDLSTLYNCTLTGNSASYLGGGAYESTLYNCIVYFNTAPDSPNVYQGSLHRPVNYSCTTPLPTNGVSNIDLDPLFVDAANGDFRLRPGSPCIDAGTNLSAILTTDFEGSPRPLDGDGDGIAAFDMGAYEFDARSMIPSDWFSSHGLDPSDPQVVSGNPDGDAFTTFQEWLADTDPTNAQSYFRIEAISKSSPATISFQSSSNRTYTLWGTPQLAPPDWTRVPGEESIPGNGGTLTLSDPTNAAQQFYRVEVNLP